MISPVPARYESINEGNFQALIQSNPTSNKSNPASIKQIQPMPKVRVSNQFQPMSAIYYKILKRLV